MAHVGLVHQPQGLLVAFATGRDPVGRGCRTAGAAVRPAGHSPDHLEVALASGRATGLDAAGDFEHTRVHGRFSPHRLSIVVLQHNHQLKDVLLFFLDEIVMVLPQQ